MKQIILIKTFFIFLTGISSKSLCQSYTIDTLKNAHAFINSFSGLPVYGLTLSKDIYAMGFNLSYDKGKPMPLQLLRINLSKKNILYKSLPFVKSATGIFWTHAFDNQGDVYLSLVGPRTVVRVNLKDSIWYENIGNPFLDGRSLIYSVSLGRDGKMYFGGSSGDTYWSSYDPATKQLEKHPYIDFFNDYVLSIAGDSDYVYAQTGQRNSVQLWSVRKKDNLKKILCKIPNTTRINLEVLTNGIYASFHSDTLGGTFKLVSGEMVKVSSTPAGAKRISYAEVNKPGAPFVKSYFDAVQNELLYSISDKPYQTIHIKTNPIRKKIWRIFSFPGDKENIYYAGEYYGNYYRYNLKQDSAYLLGKTGYNVYSILPLNDSIVYFGGYPSGYIMQWNRNQPWTTQTFINGKIVEARDANANPRILRFWKSEGQPAAGFHHTKQMLFDADKNIIGAGDVIRIGKAASIGVFNSKKNIVYGIDYTSFTGMGFSGICRWRNFVIYSMNNSLGKQPKLYFYNPALNKMVDSIDAGFNNYGKIYVYKNLLIGVANNRVYKLDLGTKKLIETYTYPQNSIADSYMLSSGTLIISTRQKIPPGFWPCVTLPYTNYLEANGIVYAIQENIIVRIKGLLKQ